MEREERKLSSFSFHHGSVGYSSVNTGAHTVAWQGSIVSTVTLEMENVTGNPTIA